MDFLTALRISGAGLGVERTRVNLATSNLANAETTRPRGRIANAKDMIESDTNSGPRQWYFARCAPSVTRPTTITAMPSPSIR